MNQKKDLCEIVPGILFLSSAKSAADLSLLENAKIKNIVCLAGKSHFAGILFNAKYTGGKSEYYLIIYFYYLFVNLQSIEFIIN